MQKKVWITSLSRDKALISGLLQLVKKYGLKPEGHFWVDDLKKMAWQAPLENLVKKDTALWIISGTRKDLEPESVRYGLSLLSISLQNKRGSEFPVMFVCSDDTIKTENLPAPLKNCGIIDSANKSLGARITARANTPVKKNKLFNTEYRIDIHASISYGIWFEFGPGSGAVWNGALAGCLNSEVNAHGVGKSGLLPMKTVLEYQMQGIKLEMGDDEYTAWAVKNKIDENQSYYVRFNDIPGTILFGEFSDGDQSDFYILKLS